MMLVVIRIGSLLPIPGVDTEYFSTLLSGFNSGDLSYLSAFTGGSFEKMSLFALSITPYITSSIIMQLLTIAIPKLEEMQKEGEDGRKKIASITRYVTIALALIESIAMAVGFGRQGLIKDYKDMSTIHYVTCIIVVVAALTAGSAVLMWIGERITEKGYYSERFTTSDNDMKTKIGRVKPYFMSDISLEKAFSFRWADLSLKGVINNLFNEEYQSVLSRPMPRLNYEIFLDIRPKWGKRNKKQ